MGMGAEDCPLSALIDRLGVGYIYPASERTRSVYAPNGSSYDTASIRTGNAEPVIPVYFETGNHETKDVITGTEESDMRTACSEYKVRRDQISKIITDSPVHREGIKIDNVIEVMNRLASDGVRDGVMQRTHGKPGYAYNGISDEESGYESEGLETGNPVFISDEDYDVAVEALTEETAEYNTEDTAIVFMSYGTEHVSNAVYERLQKRLHAAGYRNYFIGTVEGSPTVEDVLNEVQGSCAKRVVLLPLMIVADDCAGKDMAGDEKQSWKTVFFDAGYEVECVPKGTGEYEGIRKLQVSRARAAIEEKKDVILVVSFGTSYYQTRKKTIEAIEKDICAAYPGYEVRRAFTSQTIINILNKRDGYDIENVTQALSRMVREGVRNVILQPTHVMTGCEYDDMVAEASGFYGKFDSLKISMPVLVDDTDYDALVSVITEETASYDTDGTALVLMGHGTEHNANETYAKLQIKFTDAGHKNYFIGTVEAVPTVEDVLSEVKKQSFSKVVLLPLMIVAGDHATNDMSGDDEDSWKSIFTREGYEVECVLRGMGEYPGIRRIILDHLRATITG